MENDPTISLVTDTKSKKEFRVVRLGKDQVGLVFDKDDIVKVPMWYFFMVARGVRDAENRILRD
jgi:hypothetical protein